MSARGHVSWRTFARLRNFQRALFIPFSLPLLNALTVRGGCQRAHYCLSAHFFRRSITKSKHITIGTGSNFTGECLVRKTNNQPEAYCLCPRLRYLRFPLTSKNGCCASCAPGAMATCWPYIFSCFVRVTRRQARLPTSSS